MEIRCPGCDHSFSYVGETPRFCQNCGQGLSGETKVPQSTASIASDDRTIAPTAPPIRPAKPNEEGDLVGPYRLIRWLGSGGMGNVWEAVETTTGRRVALKRLSKSMVADETYVKRFVREAQLAAKISHPNVTFIYSTGSEAGQPYIAMELMPGETLNDEVDREGALSVPVAVDNILDVLAGLGAAHRLGMIHRDVKPGNCFLDTDGSIKVGDFGLSKSLLHTDTNLTQTGTFMGTPSYAAPEQIRGAELDGRTDVYSVGATLFYLLTARTPFKGDAMSVTAQIISDKAPSIRELNESVPRDLDAVIAKCLEKEPAKRFQDLDKLKSALLPYASKPESIADVGRRLAAYMIDQSMLQVISFIVIICCSVSMAIYIQIKFGIHPDQIQDEMQKRMPTFTAWATCLQFVFVQLYYAIFEGWFGRGLGKRLMGLHVVNREGQRPGFFRALLRAFAIPGCFGIALAHALWVALNYGTPTDVADYMIFFATTTIVSVVPALVCISTMRASNGLLGMHGMLSGTRVIRLNTGKQKIKVPVVKPKLNTIAVMEFGPYATRDLLGQSALGGKVYLGHDEQLNRDVWIVEHQSADKPDDQRINLARTTRQRWLEGGVVDGKRWDAFEAIHGVPIQMFVAIQKHADWSHYGQVMLDIVEELRESLSDETLPATLSLPQVWLDEDGHAKLLDKQLVEVVNANTDSFEDSRPDIKPVSPIKRAVDLVQELGDHFRRTSVLPSSVQDFLVELEKQPATELTLGWAIEELRPLTKSKGSLTWDSRLGVLGATFGIELIIYFLVAGFVFSVCYYVVPVPNRYRFVVGLICGTMLPLAFSWWFRGGPVFHFMGIQVCNSQGRAASGLNCAIRGALSWLPITAICGVFIMTLMISEAQTKHIEPEPGTLVYELLKNPVFALGILLTTLVAGTGILAGLIFAVFSPKRGLVDYLLGTRLMPK